MLRGQRSAIPVPAGSRLQPVKWFARPGHDESDRVAAVEAETGCLVCHVCVAPSPQSDRTNRRTYWPAWSPGRRVAGDSVAPMPAIRPKVANTLRRTRSMAAWIRVSAGWALIGSSAPTSAEAPAVRVPSTGPPVPVPDGWTTTELQKVMRTFSIDGSPPGQLDGYWQESFGRFLYTWGLARHQRGRALELGANPYFLTWLNTRFSELDLTLANFFGRERGPLTQHLVLQERGAHVELDMSCDLFNLEEDPFPYEDGRFDLVFFCEIIEHLLMNPLHALGEIHRILRPGGTLILTTPNAARLDNVVLTLAGGNIYDPYSGFGPYGRHNREYVRSELLRLLEFAGFDVETSFAADSHPSDLATRPEYAVVADAVLARADDLGQYLFVKATAARPPRQGLPRFLFRAGPRTAWWIEPGRSVTAYRPCPGRRTGGAGRLLRSPSPLRNRAHPGTDVIPRAPLEPHAP